MKRRSFLKIGAAGSFLAGSAGLVASRGNAMSTDTDDEFELTIAPANAEMIDGTNVWTLQYFRGLDEASPELRVREGEEVHFTVTNNDTQPHAFVVHGIPESRIRYIPSGGTRRVSFVAPIAGTYIYYDPYREPLNRVLGLHGAFIVEADDKGRTPNGSETPYSVSQHNPQMRALFDALGENRHQRFKGDGWRSGDLRREKLWLLTQIDPVLNERVASGENVRPWTVIDEFLPRYFTINGLSGFDTASHGDEDPHEGPAGRIEPSGREGEPCLLRCLNAGLANHAMHIHGNHCMELTESDPATGQIKHSANIYEHDTWFLRPMQTIDMLLPFEKPPDIPDDAWPPAEEPFPMRFVMHCHFELSQSAGGGNYPQGAVTHWQMTGPA